MAYRLVDRPKLILAILSSVIAIGIPWYYVAKKLQDVRPVNGPAAASVYWGSLWFNTRHDLGVWLHRRGVAYRVWAHRHKPAAARIGT